eukprot:Lankesteria_metandrocarpae@DN3041_c0_g1_i1.p1
MLATEYRNMLNHDNNYNSNTENSHAKVIAPHTNIHPAGQLAPGGVEVSANGSSLQWWSMKSKDFNPLLSLYHTPDHAAAPPPPQSYRTPPPPPPPRARARAPLLSAVAQYSESSSLNVRGLDNLSKFTTTTAAAA